MRIDINAEVVDQDGGAVGRLHEIVFDRESRRVAGFLVRLDDGMPREVFVRAGQAGHIGQGRITLVLDGAEAATLPDAREHLYVAPDQDLEEEIAEAESPEASAKMPDPDEAPRFSGLPGIALTPNLLVPFEVERTAIAEEQLAFGEGLRVVGADGDEIGRLGGVVVNDEAQISGIVLQGGDQVVDWTYLDILDEDANELTLTARDLDAADPPDGGAEGGR